MTKTLAQWLDYQLSTHPQAIAMGLERVKKVAERLGLTKLPCHVITVAGTNGKGSTVAFIEAIASASGYKVYSTVILAKRKSASAYLARVALIIAAGTVGPGAVLFQSSVSK